MMISVSKYIDRLSSKKEELTKIQFKLREVGELLYEMKFIGVLVRADDHLLVCENQKLLGEEMAKEQEIKST